MLKDKLFYYVILLVFCGNLFSEIKNNTFDEDFEKRFALVFVIAPVIANGSKSSKLIDACRIVKLSSENISKYSILTLDFFSAMDPDISFDGKKILFAGKKKEREYWQIWEMDINGENKKQLTFGKGNSFSPLYVGKLFHLNDEAPTGRIVYITEKKKNENIKEYAIYSSDIDGKNQNRITYNLSMITDLDVFRNGRIIYNSIDQFKAGSVLKYADLLDVNIDGTDNMGYLTNNVIAGDKRMVKVASDGKVFFIENKTDHFLGGGRLSHILEKRPLHSYKTSAHKDKGYFHSPYPTQDGGLLISYKHKEKDLYSLYYINGVSGKKAKMIYNSDKFNCIDVQLIKSRPVVRGRATFVSYKQKTGVFYCISSHISQDKNVKNLSYGDIKKVRIFEGSYSKSANAINTHLLGEAPVEKDGSFHIIVPSEMPLSFQLIDKKGKSISKQYSWTWVMPRESRGCIGCHEDRELAPPNHLSDAIIKPAVKIPAYKIKRKK